MKQEARVTTTLKIAGVLKTADGEEFPVGLDRSWRSWLLNTRANLRRRQWRALRRNLTFDLAKTLLRR